MGAQKNKRIYLSPPHIGSEELYFVEKAFESNWIAPLGPQVEAFEEEMAEYVGAKGALAVHSGTSALHLILRYLGVGPGDLVFCSTLTFIASAYPILYQGAAPVFIDSDLESWNMSPSALARAFATYEKIGSLPKAVIVVNLYGQSANLSPLLELCNQYDVPLIEDAAESLGAVYSGKQSGTMGRFGFYSFNGNKIITTSGGGMIVSNDTKAIRKMRFWASQSKEPVPYYEHKELGYNYRLSNILAAIGRGQLTVLEQRILARREIFRKYYAALSTLEGVAFMPELANSRSTRWLTAMTIDTAATEVSPERIIEALAEINVEARYIWKPMHLQPLFSKNDYFPYMPESSISDQLFRQGLCLPSGSNLTEEDQERIIDCILKLWS